VGVTEIDLSAERFFSPLTLRSHAMSTQMEQKREWRRMEQSDPISRLMMHTLQQSPTSACARNMELCAGGDDVVAC